MRGCALSSPPRRNQACAASRVDPPLYEDVSLFLSAEVVYCLIGAAVAGAVAWVSSPARAHIEQPMER